MKVFLISFFSLVMCAIALLTTRLMGLNQAFPPFESAFMESFNNQKTPQLIMMLDPKSAQSYWTEASVQNLATKNKGVILHSLVRKTTSGKLILCNCSQQQINKNSEISTSAIDLSTALSIDTQQKFILDVADNIENIHLEVFDILKKTKAESRIILTSDTHAIIESLKELLPLTVFGSSSADRMRFQVFDALFILPSVPFKGDIYWTSLKDKGVELINETIAIEMKRRHKQILLGPINSEADLKKAMEYQPFAVGTYNLNWLQENLSRLN